MDRLPIIVIPGDHVPKFEESPAFSRLKPHGDLRVFDPPLPDINAFISRTKDADVIIQGGTPIHKEILDYLPRLKMIAVAGVGTDSIALEETHRRGILVANVPIATSHIVAEHALALMLGLAKSIAFQTTSIREGRWEATENILLRGKILGVIGTGGIGSEIIRLGKALGMNVIGCTLHPSAARAEKLGIRYVELDELLKNSDVVTISIPLKPTTHQFISKREFKLMKSDSLLINVARGKVVDQDALVSSLRSGAIRGAGLDVFEEEPIPINSPILSCENVILTPHVGSTTPEAIGLLANGVVDNIISFLTGSPQNAV